MKAYKGFNKDLQCRGFQFESGKEYIEERAKCCEAGFHACEHPLDVFRYYSPADSRFCEVELDGELDQKDQDDTKVAATRIRIGAELSLRSMIEAAIKFTFDRATWSKENHVKEEKAAASATGDAGAASATGYAGAASATGTRGAASATGTRGAASATGYAGAASATGDAGAASATGDAGAASATGDAGAASATGDAGAASATGTRGAASATGDAGAASATGTRGAASATGYAGAASATGTRGAASATGTRGAASATGTRGAASATGPKSIACALGYQGRAKAAIGNWIVVAERDQYENILSVQTALVDGETIKVDTYYRLEGGKFVEVTDEE